AMARLKVDKIGGRDETGQRVNFYLDSDLEWALPQLPRQEVPEGKITTEDVAAELGISEGAAKQRLLKAKIRSAGKYITPLKRNGAYYDIDELVAAGIIERPQKNA